VGNRAAVDRLDDLETGNETQSRRNQKNMASLILASWNHVARLLLQIQALQQAA